MKTTIALLLTMLMAASALAIIDPDPNTMGLYFDEEANIVCATGVTPFSQVDLYLTLTSPTFDNLYGFEAGLTLEGEGLVLAVYFSNPQALNVGDLTNLIVGFGAPTATTEATVVARWTILYTSATLEGLDFYLHGTTPSSLDPMYPTLLLADGELMSVATTVIEGPNASINGCPVIAVEEMSFDSVKSLYR